MTYFSTDFDSGHGRFEDAAPAAEPTLNPLRLLGLTQNIRGNTLHVVVDKRVRQPQIDSMKVDSTDTASTSEYYYGGVAATVPGVVQAEEFDNGGEGVGYSDTSIANEGGQLRLEEAVDIDVIDGGYIVGWMAKDEYLRYSVDVTENVDAFDFTFRVSSISGLGKLRIVTGGTGCDSYSTSLSGLVSVPNTGGWSSYEDVSVSGGGDGGLDAGINHIWLCVVSAGLNVDFFSMTPTEGPYGGVAATVPGLIEVEEFDYGGEGVAYTDTSETNEGGAFRTDEAVDIEPVGDGFVVGWMGKDEYMRYTVDVTENVDAFDFSFRVSSNSGFGKLRIVTGGTGCDSYSTSLSGLVSVPNTGGWYSYEDVSVSGGGDGGLDAGINHIWLCVVSAGLNVDFFSMTPTEGPYGGVAATVPGLIEVEEFDYGGEGVAYTDTSETNEGGAFRTDEAVDIEPVGDGFVVGWMGKDEYMRSFNGANRISYSGANSSSYSGANSSSYSGANTSSFDGANRISYSGANSSSYSGANSSSYSDFNRSSYSGANSSTYSDANSSSYSGANSSTYCNPNNSSYSGANSSSYSGANSSSYSGANRSSYNDANRSSYSGANSSPYCNANSSSHSGANRSSYSGANRSTYSGANSSSYSGANSSSYSGANSSSYSDANRSSYSGANSSTYSDANSSSYSGANSSTYCNPNNSSYSGANSSSYSGANSSSYSGANRSSYNDANRSSYSGANSSPYCNANSSSHSGANRSSYSGANRSTYSGANSSPYCNANSSSHSGANRSSYSGANRSTYSGANSSSYSGANSSSYSGANRSTYIDANRSSYSGANSSTYCNANSSSYSGANSSSFSGANSSSYRIADQENYTRTHYGSIPGAYYSSNPGAYYSSYTCAYSTSYTSGAKRSLWRCSGVHTRYN
eukprot:jgi/Undpi1/84/HiC_scaffold_1.g00084.m1